MQFAVMLTVLSNLVQYYIYYGQQVTNAKSTERLGLPLCILSAAVLLMVHPTVFLLKDLQIVSPLCQHHWGSLVLYGCTHVGLLLLLFGASWAARSPLEMSTTGS